MTDTLATAAAQPRDATLNRPEGFHRMRSGGGFVAHNGPLHVKRMSDHVLLGLRIDERHLNPMGILHGGMLATFADMLLPITIHHDAPQIGRRFLPTINLQIDYLASAKPGQWLQGRAQVLRVTRSLVFTQGLISADDTPVARISGIFKLGAEFSPQFMRAQASAADPA